jgi:hypothetical protein
MRSWRAIGCGREIEQPELVGECEISRRCDADLSASSAWRELWRGSCFASCSCRKNEATRRHVGDSLSLFAWRGAILFPNLHVLSATSVTPLVALELVGGSFFCPRIHAKPTKSALREVKLSSSIENAAGAVLENSELKVALSDLGGET